MMVVPYKFELNVWRASESMPDRPDMYVFPQAVTAVYSVVVS
jgi:hypothetical protein